MDSVKGQRINGIVMARLERVELATWAITTKLEKEFQSSASTLDQAIASILGRMVWN